MPRLFGAVVAITICAPALAYSAPRWTMQKVARLYCELIDPVHIENYWFNDKGLVAVTLGTKGRITPPLWYWRIRNGKLQLSDEDTIKQEFTLVSMRGGILTVRRRSGDIARFHYRFEHRTT